MSDDKATDTRVQNASIESDVSVLGREGRSVRFPRPTAGHVSTARPGIVPALPRTVYGVRPREATDQRFARILDESINEARAAGCEAATNMAIARRMGCDELQWSRP
jgi:hypothetical protein